MMDAEREDEQRRHQSKSRRITQGHAQRSRRKVQQRREQRQRRRARGAA